jgi:hypothetical protein
LLLFILQQYQVTLCYLSRQRHWCHNFQHVGQYIEIFWKKVPIYPSLHLVEMDADPDPDPQNWFRIVFYHKFSVSEARRVNRIFLQQELTCVGAEV